MIGATEKHKNGMLSDEQRMLSVDTRLYLVDKEIESIAGKVNDIGAKIQASVKWIIGAFLVSGIGALILVGAYKERVDTTARAVERLEARTAQMAEKISALTAAIEAQNRR